MKLNPTPLTKPKVTKSFNLRPQSPKLLKPHKPQKISGKTLRKLQSPYKLQYPPHTPNQNGLTLQSQFTFDLDSDTDLNEWWWDDSTLPHNTETEAKPTHNPIPDEIQTEPIHTPIPNKPKVEPTHNPTPEIEVQPTAAINPQTEVHSTYSTIPSPQSLRILHSVSIKSRLKSTNSDYCTRTWLQW